MLISILIRFDGYDLPTLDVRSEPLQILWNVGFNRRSHNHLLILPDCCHEAGTTRRIKFRKNIIQDNDWVAGGGLGP